ncbi:MAG: hypothetical protein LBH63_05080, partial [Clostridiales Family XIII bacterium]|nr:hypothetical protein [Clostridiales Family XIII bacterium]
MNENVKKLMKWIENPNLDNASKEELRVLLSEYESEGDGGKAAEEIDDRFYRDLAFGTAGMRGVMGAGTNRMNALTVRRASQGFADSLLESSGGVARDGSLGIVIAYDN